MILGAAGIVLFNGPMNATGDSCYCLIPSPEPAAAQGTSSILLVLGLMFFPMGLMKGGVPSFGRGPRVPSGAPVPPGGAVVRPSMVASGGLFVFGVVVLILGVDAVLVPAYLVYSNVYYEVAGVLFAAAGAVSMLWGLRKPKS